MSKLSKIVISEMLKTKSVRQISEELGVKYQKLYIFCQRNNLNTSPKGKKIKTRKKLDEFKMLEMYASGWTLQMIANFFDISRGTARSRIKERVRALRTKSESATNYINSLTEEQKQARIAVAHRIRQARAFLNNFKKPK